MTEKIIRIINYVIIVYAEKLDKKKHIYAAIMYVLPKII